MAHLIYIPVILLIGIGLGIGLAAVWTRNLIDPDDITINDFEDDYHGNDNEWGLEKAPIDRSMLDS